jgi:cyclopropane fatty-acyl-phospholipid synthase-like methyltransferase
MYTGLDIRKKTIEDAKNTFKMLTYANFVDTDLVKPDIPLDFNATIVVCFEVVEHIGKQNIQIFLKNMRMCGGQDATYYLSTPNHDPDVGAAGNHTYDSGDGRGVDIQEFDHFELQEHILKAGFKIVNKFGTFASQRDYKESLNSWQVRMFEELHKYYDSNLLSNLMAPVIEPELARNVLWVLKRK